MENERFFEMSNSMKVALSLIGGCFAWLIGLVIGKFIIAAVFAESAALIIIWGIILFIALVSAIAYYIDNL